MNPITFVEENQRVEIRFESPDILEFERDGYTVNHVIEAYVQGKEFGKTMADKALTHVFSNNIEKTVGIEKEVVKHLKEQKFSPLASYLKVHSFYAFQVLIVVTEDNFNSDDFLKVYDYIHDVELKENSELYNISFNFTNSSDYFNENHLKTDGYLVKIRS